MSTVKLSRVEVDRCIDVLDRSEPSRSDWATEFNSLKSALENARKIRNRFRLPIIVLFVPAVTISIVGRLAPDLLDLHGFWSGTFTIACGVLFLALELVMRVVFPVLQREARVAALLRHYGATNVSPSQAVY